MFLVSKPNVTWNNEYFETFIIITVAPFCSYLCKRTSNFLDFSALCDSPNTLIYIFD